jgi:hypothetical protein
MENEIIYQKSYEEFKQELDTEIQRTAESFVRIGYLLKVARDTNVLEGSQYKSVTEFAEAEYGLNATYVSRFISINNRFAENGYSDRLDAKYQGFGYAKLTVMLQLPDSMNEELNPGMSKADITTLKDEFDAEQEVSDIERLLEEPSAAAYNLEDIDDHSRLLYETILALGEAEPELYTKVASEAWIEELEKLIEQLPLIMAPSETKVYSVRVMGKGRMMLTCSEDKVSIVNSRTGEKENYEWSDIAAAWVYAGAVSELPFDKNPIEKWEARYEKKYPIAPVQEKETKKKESKVVKAKSENEEPEEQVEGQMSIEDYPEVLPANKSVCTPEMQTETIDEQESEDDSQELESKPQEVDSKYPESVEFERKEVLELLDGLRAEVCKPNITSNSIRELKDNTGYLVTKALNDLAEALWEYEIEQPDEEDENETED